MPTNRPDPGVAPDRTEDADATSPPDPTRPNDGLPPTAHLGGRPYPFLSPPSQPDDLGTLGPYRVVKLLGEGGMGFVFRGEDDALRRPVALKVMRPEVAAGENARERFLREGRAAAAVKSDHVITIYQVGEANGVPFLAMEFLAGATLDDWLKGRGGSAPAAAIVKVAKDTLRGLGAAHDRGLIHRDIKPANLWLEAGTGRVKVLDFGLTRGSDDVLTREGALVGTPSYMAPEQAAGRAIDARADLFSVGVVLYRMAAGKNPFQRGDVWATLTALAVDVPPPAGSVSAGLPPGLGELIDQFVSKNAADRPESARAALATLAEIEKAMKGGTAPALPVVNMPVVYAPPAAAEVNNAWAAVTEAVTELDAAPAAALSEPAPAAARRRSLVPLVSGLVGLVVVAAGAVGLALLMRGEPEVTKTNPPEEKGKSSVPPLAAKQPEELLVPAAGPVVKAGPSPFDALDPAKIPAAERVASLPKETVAVLGSHLGDVRGWWLGNPIRFSPDGARFATGYQNTRWYAGVTLYDAATLESVWSDPAGGAFAFSADGKWLASTLSRQAFTSHGQRLVDLTGRTPLPGREFGFHGENGTSALAFLADGKTVLAGTGWGGLYAWDTTDPGAKPARVLRAGDESLKRVVRQLAVSADGRRVVDADGASGAPSFLGVWDVAGEPKERFRIPEPPGLIGVALTPDGSRLVVHRDTGAGSTHHLDVWQLDGADPVRESTTPLGAQYAPLGSVTDDGKQVFLGGNKSVLMNLGPTGVTKARDLAPFAVAVPPDVSRQVQVRALRFRVLDGTGKAGVEPGEEVCGSDAVPVAAGGRVFTFHPSTRAWAVKDGRLVPEPVALADDLGASRMQGAATAPDGRMVVGVGADFILRAFSTAPGATRITARVSRDTLGASNVSSRFAWHPDGRRVVVAVPDGSAYLWDVTTELAPRSDGVPVSSPERAGALHLAVAPAGDALAACDPLELGGGALVRRLNAPKASARVLAGVPGEFALSSQFLPDGRSLLVAFRKDNEPFRVRRYDLTKRDPVPELLWEFAARPMTAGEGLHVIQLSRDGTRVLGYVNTRAYVVDVATRRELIGVDLEEQIHTPPQAQVRWADDGRHVLLGQHGCVYVLRVPDRQ